MAQITLTKALKLKKKLAGEMAELCSKLGKHNSYEEGQTPKYNTKEVLIEYTTLQEKLTDLKVKIAKANEGILHDILTLAELKQVLSLLRGLDAKEGLTRIGYQGDIKVNMISTISSKEKDQFIKSTQDAIGNLQDKIEEYNATTKIEF